MKSHRTFALGISSLVILVAVLAGCSRGILGESVESFVRGPHRVVTISYRDGSSNPCEVDYPVTLLRMSKSHTIAWYADDHDYWVYFDNGFPIVNGTNPIYVKKGAPPKEYSVALPAATPKMYFTYAVYDSSPGMNPSPNAACQSATDDHDTGVNVKR
jgi:hypothetical protein